VRNHTQFDQLRRVDLFLFLLGFLQKKEHFIEYSLVWKESVPKCLIIFDEPKGGVDNLFFKLILRPILPIKHWTYTYRRWNMYCIERITHLRNPISYIWLVFSHLCSNNKGILQIFHDFKENCRITMEFSGKVDSIKYSTIP
jgi:hypothetical protein